ncbi:hypothetical protein SLA2020_524630 [Shorea laevis]
MLSSEILISSTDLFSESPIVLLLSSSSQLNTDHRTFNSNWDHIFYFCSDETLECQSQIVLKVNDVFEDFTIVASCNGLLCLLLDIDEQIYLWNPATSEDIKPYPLPLHPRSQYDKYMRMKCGVFPITVGFGFDKRSNDFKVLRICNVVRNNHNKRCYYDEDTGSNLRKKGSKRQVEVYSLNTRKWRRLDLRVPFDEVYLRGPVDPVPYFPTTAFDGVFFWWVLPTKHYDKEEIVAFDFGDELFRTTPLPDGAHFSDFSSVHFTVLNESLAIVGFPKESIGFCSKKFPSRKRMHGETSSPSLVIWILFGFGVNESWTKLINIPLLLDYPERPLGFSRNGELFMQNSEGQLLLYDLLTHSKKDVPRDRSAGDSIDGIKACCKFFPTRV